MGRLGMRPKVVGALRAPGPVSPPEVAATGRGYPTLSVGDVTSGPRVNNARFAGYGTAIFGTRKDPAIMIFHP